MTMTVERDLGRFIENNGRLIHKYIDSYMKRKGFYVDSEYTQDIYQDVCCMLHKNRVLERYVEGRNATFETYIRTCLNNSISMCFKRGGKDKQLLRQESISIEEMDDLSAPSNYEDIDLLYDYKTFIKIFKDRHRKYKSKVMDMLFSGLYDIEDIAITNDISVVAVYRLQHIAFRSFKKYLNKASNRPK